MSTQIPGTDINSDLTDKYEIQVNFERGNATYKPQETVTGFISFSSKITSKYKLEAELISISVLGQLTPQTKHNNKVIEAISSKVKPIIIINIQDLQIAKSKTINQNTKIPFRFKLEKGEHKFLQTYFGVYLSISYSITVKAKFRQGKIKQQTPFYVVVPKAGREAIEKFEYPKKKNFVVRWEDIKSQTGTVPKFKIKGQFQSEIVYFNDDLNGFLTIDTADSAIRSIDLQMLRVEKVEQGTDKFSEKTQIQMIQICDGDVTRNLQIPVYMILPRYYSCPSVRYQWCTVDFEVNLLIIFRDGFKVTCNIPFKFIRS